MEHTVHPSPNGAGHEHAEVSVKLIVVSLAFLAVANSYLVFLLVVGIFRYFYDTYSTAEATRLSRPVDSSRAAHRSSAVRAIAATAGQRRSHPEHIRVGWTSRMA